MAVRRWLAQLTLAVLVLPLTVGVWGGVSGASKPARPIHPLDPLTAAELQRTYETVSQHAGTGALPADQLLFPSVHLEEPPKDLVLAWQPGQPFPRRARAEVMHHPSNRLWTAIVDVGAGKLESLEPEPAGTQGAVTAEEFVAAAEAVESYGPWQQAMLARGVSPADVYVDVWAPGDVPLPADELVAPLSHGEQTRLLRAIAYHRGGDPDTMDPAHPHNPYARPIEGVVATVDMNARRVVHLTDTLLRPVSTASGSAGKQPSDLRALAVRQPRGGSIQLDGQRVRWQNWSFLASLHQREGLVLHDVRLLDGSAWRPVAYRMSLSEIYVPYGIDDENWNWRSAFDVGEYNLGSYAQPLEVDRDVPENALLLDAVLPTDVGPTADNPTGAFVAPASIGMYERDAGLLWTRTDPSNVVRDTRFARELVATWNAWIGNYIYGFNWVFGQDGDIDVQVTLTGTTLNRGGTHAAEPSAPAVGTDAAGAVVEAPNHQHFFSFRLDLDVDGTSNTAATSDVAPVATSDHAFAATTTPVDSEGAADADSAASRSWQIRSAARTNASGRPTAFTLRPGETTPPYSTDAFAPLQRAAFARHAFWITTYRAGERYAAGDHPNQGVPGAGLAAFTAPAEALPSTGADLVVWYTAGTTHVPKPEEYPVMPAETIHFRLAPDGFFDANPALGAPDQAARP